MLFVLKEAINCSFKRDLTYFLSLFIYSYLLLLFKKKSMEIILLFFLIKLLGFCHYQHLQTCHIPSAYTGADHFYFISLRVVFCIMPLF